VIRALLSDKALEALRNRAKEGLATEGVERTRLVYDVLVKLKVDELLDQESIQMAVEDDQPFLKRAATGSHAGEASVIVVSGRMESESLYDVVQQISTGAQTGRRTWL
jgi:hypothetical protein